VVKQLEKSDASTRQVEPKFRPNAVVFSGDGEPQTPEWIVGRLGELLAAGKLEQDSYSQGGSVEALETQAAEALGKEAAVWLPTGTLANHLALRRHAGIRSRVILQEQSHIYHDEGDGLAKLSGLNPVPLANDRPYFTADELRTALEQAVSGRVLNPVGAVSIESPVRRQAGQVVPLDEIRSIVALCRDEGIPSHLDGARLYMMSAATGVGVSEYAAMFDSVYVSMYKYFGSPFGGVVAGTHAFIDSMFHDRRMFGGGLSSGYLPAALSLDGMDGFEARFGEAFAKAKTLFAMLDKLAGVEVREFEHGSNIFELVLGDGIDTDAFVAKLLQSEIALPWPNPDWARPLIHVNTTVLRRSNDEIVAAFSEAAAAG
jgi:threonine aldolase